MIDPRQRVQIEQDREGGCSLGLSSSVLPVSKFKAQISKINQI